MISDKNLNLCKDLREPDIINMCINIEDKLIFNLFLKNDCLTQKINNNVL